MELGRDADTGRHITYVIELARWGASAKFFSGLARKDTRSPDMLYHLQSRSLAAAITAH